MFIIFLPIFFRDGRVPITGFFTILSLANVLRRTTFTFLVRVIIQLFDVRVGLTRVQVGVSLSSSIAARRDGGNVV